jgi:hypothetical protein
MKNVLTLSVLSFALFCTVTITAAQAEPERTRVTILKPEVIYSPRGFDSNDNAQVVVSGSFTGYCMKTRSMEKKIDLNNRRIYLTHSVTIADGCTDLAMYIPYSNVVDLGPLPAGQYEIGAQDENGAFVRMGSLPIAKAAVLNTHSTDERVYAPVTSVSFSMTPAMSEPVITLGGILTNSCLNPANLEIRQTANNVIEVLPTLAVSRDNCKAVAVRYQKSVTLKGFPSTDTLIHIRAMNGQAINRVITRLDRL